MGGGTRDSCALVCHPIGTAEAAPLQNRKFMDRLQENCHPVGSNRRSQGCADPGTSTSAAKVETLAGKTGGRSPEYSQPKMNSAAGPQTRP
jgi:hypothetical protein